MFDLINPSRIFIWIERLINFINSIFFIILIIALTFALLLSPPDYLQGDSVRIMYVHVPSAWIGLFSYTTIALLSILNFIFKIKNLSLITKSIAPIGLMFTCLAIVTGSLWGQPTWGTWWVWDARLTSMLVLLIFYLTYILIWKFIENFNTANIITCFIAIVGSFNIPVIKYSVEWWNTLHQPSSITLTSAPTIHYSMLIPLIIMILGLFLYSLVIFFMRYKIELIKLKLNKKNKKIN